MIASGRLSKSASHLSFNPLQLFVTSFSAAKATDNLGAETLSSLVTVKVANPPIVSSKPLQVSSEPIVSDPVSLKLAPNPATSIVNISTTGLPQDQQATISVISATGVVMKMMQIKSLTRTIPLDVSSLLRGEYTVKIISGDKVLYKQFLKL